MKKRVFLTHDNFRGVEKEAFEISKEKKQWSARHNSIFFTGFAKVVPSPKIMACAA